MSIKRKSSATTTVIHGYNGDATKVNVKLNHIETCLPRDLRERSHWCIESGVFHVGP